MSRSLRIGTRASALALAQTHLVIDSLRWLRPDVETEIVEISTLGDRTQHTNLPAERWGEGVFVRELESALLSDRIDLAVHSLKDLPPTAPDTLTLAAVPERADPRDVLVTGQGLALADLPANARVGTSSARRAALLHAARPDLQFLPIRGNVDTRLKKLTDGDYDAIVLAKAGLDRLGLQVAHVVLEPAELTPAPGQGALGLQTRSADGWARDLLSELDHQPTRLAVQAERLVMAELDASCRLPLGALGTVRQGRLELLAVAASTDGVRQARAVEIGFLTSWERVARRVVSRMRAEGAVSLLSETAAV